MWDNMMGWHGAWGPGGMAWPLHLLWWALIIGAIAVLACWLLSPRRRGGGGGEDRALSILRERYARGEIDKAEFDARKRDLS